jgi:hypothetical protein
MTDISRATQPKRSWRPSYAAQFVAGYIGFSVAAAAAEAALGSKDSFDFNHAAVLVGFYCILSALWDIRKAVKTEPPKPPVP